MTHSKHTRRFRLVLAAVAFTLSAQAMAQSDISEEKQTKIDSKGNQNNDVFLDEDGNSNFVDFDFTDLDDGQHVEP